MRRLATMAEKPSGESLDSECAGAQGSKREGAQTGDGSRADTTGFGRRQ